MYFVESYWPDEACIRAFMKEGRCSFREAVTLYAFFVVHGLLEQFTTNPSLLRNVRLDLHYTETQDALRKSILALPFWYIPESDFEREGMPYDKIVTYLALLSTDEDDWSKQRPEICQGQLRFLLSAVWRQGFMQSRPLYRGHVVQIRQPRFFTTLLSQVATEWMPEQNEGSLDTLRFILGFRLPEYVQFTASDVVASAKESQDKDVYRADSAGWEKRLAEVLRIRLEKDDWTPAALAAWLRRDDLDPLVTRRLVQALAKKGDLDTVRRALASVA